MTWLLAITTMSAFAQQATVTGPDSFLKVNVSVKQGIPIYSVTYKDKTILEDSPLGFVANVGDFSRDMTFTGQKENKIDKTYTQDRIKQSQIHYQANELTCTFTNKEKKNIKKIGVMYIRIVCWKKVCGHCGQERRTHERRIINPTGGSTGRNQQQSG